MTRIEGRTQNFSPGFFFSAAMDSHPFLPPAFFSKSLLPIYLCTFLFWASIYIYMPILPPYVQRIGGSLQSVGWVMSAYGLSQLILRIPLGLLSDRWGRRKPFVQLGFFLAGIGALGLILSPSVSWLFLSVLVVGIGASMWVPFSVLFASHFAPFLLGAAMGMLMFISRLSQVISNYAGGQIAERKGWEAPFAAAGLLALMGFLLALALGERSREAKGTSVGRKVRTVLHHRQVLWASGLGLLMQFANFSTTYGFTPIYAQHLGASKGDLGFLLFLYTVPNAIVTYLAGPLSVRLGERTVVSLGFLIVACAVFLTPFAQPLGFLFLLQAWNGVGNGLIFPLLMGLSIKSVSDEYRGTAMGTFQSIYALGMTAGPAVSGWVGDRLGLSAIFCLSGLLTAGGAFLSWKKIA
jgi:MFS family permease